MNNSCAGQFAIAAPLCFIAFLILVIGILEYLRRRRTANQDDDWGP